MSFTLGALLAGGRAHRLGGAGKATLEVSGRPLLHYALGALSAVVDEVAIVAKRDTALPPVDPEVGLWIEPDEPRHPLAGIVHALRGAAGRSVLVCAADMPLITPAVLGALLAARADAALAVVPRAAGRLQPVCALYRPGALAALDGFPPDARTTDAVEAIGIEVVDFGDAAEPFLSVNTPADLELATRLLRARH